MSWREAETTYLLWLKLNALMFFPASLAAGPDLSHAAHLKQILSLQLLTQRRQDSSWWGSSQLHLSRGSIQHRHQQWHLAGWGVGLGQSVLRPMFLPGSIFACDLNTASVPSASKPDFPAFFKTHSYLKSFNMLLPSSDQSQLFATKEADWRKLP